MLVPNLYRTIIKPIPIKDLQTSSGLVIPGQLKTGENLFLGEIVSAGKVKDKDGRLVDNATFTKGQKVFYSEYSAASLIDIKPILEADVDYSKKEQYVVVAMDDIMAYYDEDFDISEDVIGNDTTKISGAIETS